MAKLIIEVPTKEHAVTLACWYTLLGEQFAEGWFEDRELKTPMSDTHRRSGCINVLDKDTVVLYTICHEV